MTKKVLFGMAAFTMLFVSSCQNELDVFSSSETSTVSFKVETPEIQSRAYSDGSTATVLQYAVYNAQGEELTDLTVTNGEIHGSTTVELQLTTGNSYSVIFWAGAEGAPYKVDFAKKTMTVDYTDSKTFSNDEKRDAFYKYHEFTVKGAQTETIELKRPFAQLNIGTSDYAASTSAGYVPTHSSVKVSNVYKTLDLVEGKVSNKAEFTVNGGTSGTGGITINGATGNGNASTSEVLNPVTFASALIKRDETFPDVESGKTYEYLAMNYLLVSADKELVDIEYTYTDGSNAKTRTVGSVPVQRNYRTNIYGKLLTSAVDFNVKINPDYEEPDYNIYHVHVAGEVYTDFAEAVAKAIELGEPVEFVEDIAIDADNTITVPEGKTLTLNLNGKTLSGITDDADKNDDNQFTSADNEVMFDVRGTMNINNGIVTIKHTSNNMGNNAAHEIAYVGFNGTLNVTNATLENYGGTNMAYCIDMVNAKAPNGATINIENSTLKSSYIAVRVFNNGAGKHNVSVMNSTLQGKYAFWVQYYNVADFGTQEKADAAAALLNIDIFNGTNTIIGKNDTPVLYGFNDAVYFNAEGKIVVTVSDIDELKAAIGNDKIVVLDENIEGQTIKFPSALSNFTFKAAKDVVIKNTTISAADGNSYNYDGLTFDGLTFENSRILLTGWRNGEEVLKNLTITNCIFKNLDDDTNTAPVHINKDASEAVENFTFTNNVINGATGGSKSGVYAQVTGNVLVANNVINNVSFRPYVIQITTDDNIADSFVVTGNTFSGSAVGRAQGLGSNAAGPDAVEIVVSGNIFKGITESQQICYWNFNSAVTTADLSKNYYDIDIEANPAKIYFNAAASSVADLKNMGVYPFYTQLNQDGSINVNSLKTAE